MNYNLHLLFEYLKVYFAGRLCYLVQYRYHLQSQTTHLCLL
nr:MAG TPA: hypothetical protein [Caudoviricetes sp.]